MVELSVQGPFSVYPKFQQGSFTELRASSYGARYWYDGTVRLDDAPDLPSVPGHYFVLNQLYNVLYVGQSLDIRKRWFEGHHQFFRAKQQGGHWIGYVQSLPIDAVIQDKQAVKALLLTEEAALIRLYAPLLNREKHSSLVLRSRQRKQAVKFFERLAGETRLGRTPTADSLALFFYANEIFLGRTDAMVLAVLATRDRHPHLLDEWSCVLPHWKE